MNKIVIVAGLAVLAFACNRALAGGTNEAAAAWTAIGEGALVVDVRTPAEFKKGHIEKAVNIPYNEVGKRLAEFGSDKDRPVVVYCMSGHRAGRARAELVKNGFTKVINAGGLDDLKAAKPAP